jgi:iron(III) transport system permease protein
MRSRLAITLAWLLLLAPPLSALVLELLKYPAVWTAWAETERLLELSRNTFVLVFGTLGISVPVGAMAALLIYRCDLPGRGLLHRLVVPILFIPLPLLVSAWQASLGSGGWLVVRAWQTQGAHETTGVIPWKPWASGLPAAIWVHAMAALPWVIWLVGQGLRWVESGLEEDALTSGKPWLVVRRVTLYRALPLVAMAALWVGVQTAAEVTITDMLQVRTFAEEVYSEFARPDPVPNADSHDVLARAIVLAIPPTMLTALLVGLVLPQWQRRSPPLASVPAHKLDFPLGPWRWPASIAVVALFLLMLGVPIGSLIWRTGHVPPDDSWSIVVAGKYLARASRGEAVRLAVSLAVSLVAGIGTAALALFGCWIARDRRWLRTSLTIALILIWTLPGPVVGIGLKEAINRLMDIEDVVSGGHTEIARRLLYDGPSPLPVIWATCIRFLPCAAALLWPVVRLIPSELFDAARTSGASAWQEFRHVVWPLTQTAGVRAALAVAALSLGELSASKLVETPAGQTLAHEIFTQMHYGVTNHLAAMCLLLLAAIAAVGLIWQAAESILSATGDSELVPCPRSPSNERLPAGL